MALTKHQWKCSIVSFLLLGCVSAAAITAEDILILGLFKDMAILRAGEQQYTLRVGEEKAGIRLISATSEEAVLEINGQQQSYALGSPVSMSTEFARPERAEARIWPDRGMYMVKGAINGLPVDFMVDTGASSVAMSAAHAKRLGINFRYEGKQSWATTANGVARTYLVTLDSVRVGEIELHNVEGAVLENSSSNQILLGMSFLQRLDMIREGNMMLLRQKY